MFVDERLELADDVRMATELDVGLEAVLQTGQAQLREPRHLALGEGLIHDVGEGSSAPEQERLFQGAGGASRIAVGKRLSSFAEESLEAPNIQRAILDADQVARSAGLDDLR